MRWVLAGLGVLCALSGCGSRSALSADEPEASAGRGGSMAAGSGGRINGGASGSGGSPTAGAGGTGSGGSLGTGAEDAGSPDAPRGRVLSQVIANAPWYTGQFTTGMAVDTRGRLFINGDGRVYVLERSVLDIYLTGHDVSLALAALGDLDVSPDDALYVASSMGILRSEAPHEAQLWREGAESRGAAKLGVVDVDDVAFVTREGLRGASGTSGDRLLIDHDRIQGTSGCATEDLAVARSGTFLYQPGCQGSPLLRGNVHDASVSVLYAAGPDEVRFRCATRDPAGGFYLVVEEVDEELLLYHVAEDANGAAGLTLIHVTPSLSEARRMQDLRLAFLFCSIAAGPDGTIYLQTHDQLWKLSAP